MENLDPSRHLSSLADAASPQATHRTLLLIPDIVCNTVSKQERLCGTQHARSAVLTYFGKMGIPGSTRALRRLGGGTGLSAMHVRLT
jgi:hypothetical protein